jgi:hypothetical protein
MSPQRFPQPDGTKGSLKWIQRAVEDHPTLLVNAIRAAALRQPGWTIEWVSPRRHDEWAEYRDAGFLRQLRREDLVDELASFWPPRGPQWDALGIGSDGTIVLIEAKARIHELVSSCGALSASTRRIATALAGAKPAFSAPVTADWLNGYYQYANRLAHLEFFRAHGVEALMVFVYFCGAAEVSGPASPEEWRPALDAMAGHLGVATDLRARGVLKVFVSVEALSA